MIVTMQNKGHSITGLCIGNANVRRYFRSDIRAIEIEIDHLRIRCDLQGRFWGDRPEINDRRLCAWLEEKFFWPKSSEAIVVEMEGSGDRYRLKLRSSQKEKPRHAVLQA
jgi:hypothetical protein